MFKNKELLRAVGKGMAFGWSIMAVIMLILSVIMTLTDITDKIIQLAMGLALAVNAYASSHRSTQIYRHNGFQQGLICGLFYALPILIISTIAMGYVSDYCLVKVIVVLIFAVAGGIAGINTKRTKAKGI